MFEKNILPRSQKPPSACDLMQAVFETMGKYFFYPDLPAGKFRDLKIDVYGKPQTLNISR